MYVAEVLSSINSLLRSLVYSSEQGKLERLAKTGLAATIGAIKQHDTACQIKRLSIAKAPEWPKREVAQPLPTPPYSPCYGVQLRLPRISRGKSLARQLNQMHRPLTSITRSGTNSFKIVEH